jgi:hypothetical protein
MHQVSPNKRVKPFGRLHVCSSCKRPTIFTYTDDKRRIIIEASCSICIRHYSVSDHGSRRSPRFRFRWDMPLQTQQKKCTSHRHAHNLLMNCVLSANRLFPLCPCSSSSCPFCRSASKHIPACACLSYEILPSFIRIRHRRP